MLEDLAEAIETLGIPIDGVGLVQVLALRDRLDARIAETVGPSTPLRCGTSTTATSMTAWLRASAAMTSRSAGPLSRRLRKLPITSAAYRTEASAQAFLG